MPDSTDIVFSPCAGGLSQILYPQLLTQELSGKACLAGSYFFRSSGYNEIAALVAAFRTEVDDIVGTLDDIQIVLNHYQRMAPFYQGIEGMEQALDVARCVEAC